MNRENVPAEPGGDAPYAEQDPDAEQDRGEHRKPRRVVHQPTGGRPDRDGEHSEHLLAAVRGVREALESEHGSVQAARPVGRLPAGDGDQAEPCEPVRDHGGDHGRADTVGDDGDEDPDVDRQARAEARARCRKIHTGSLGRRPCVVKVALTIQEAA